MLIKMHLHTTKSSSFQLAYELEATWHQRSLIQVTQVNYRKGTKTLSWYYSYYFSFFYY